MAGKTKKILTAAGVAAATAGLAVAANRKMNSKAANGAATYHVKPAGDGWAVEADGGKRAQSRHDNKKSAVSAGRELARSKAPSRLVIHGADGSVQRSHDYEAV